MQDNQRVRDHVDAGGVRTYYEMIGEGEPVLLLHGGLCTIETWGPQIPALAEKYRLIMPERRGHGRTRDLPGPITYEIMVDDTIAFMDALRLESAHLIGWSDGAMIALMVAMKRPGLVRKLGYISQPLNPDGTRPKYVAMMAQMTPAHLPPFLEAGYAAVSPDGPAHYAVVAEKMVAAWRADRGIPLENIRGVQTPTLVLVGDDDIGTVEGAAAMQAAMPSAQLAVIPGASHALAMEKPEVVNRLLLDFLAAEQPKKLFGAR